MTVKPASLPLTALNRPAFARLLRLWWRNARTRRQLRDLPPERLADIGLTPQEARREADLPFFWHR